MQNIGVNDVIGTVIIWSVWIDYGSKNNVQLVLLWFFTLKFGLNIETFKCMFLH